MLRGTNEGCHQPSACMAADPPYSAKVLFISALYVLPQSGLKAGNCSIIIVGDFRATPYLMQLQTSCRLCGQAGEQALPRYYA